MIWRLGLLFTVVPLVETALLIWIGSRIGPLPTVLMLLLSGLLGAWLAKREGAAVFRRLVADLQRGLPPAMHLVEGALVFAGALLLVTPGTVTDLVGLLLLFPPSRRAFAPVFLRWLAKRFDVKVSFGPPGFDPEVSRERTAPPKKSPFDHPIR